MTPESHQQQHIRAADHTFPSRESELQPGPSLTDILQNDFAFELESALFHKRDSGALKALKTEESVLAFMESSLKGSYIFSKHVVPKYVANVFSSLAELPPVRDDLGETLIGITELALGELANNNIFCRTRESHSHFYDLYESFQDAGGDTNRIDSFMRNAETHGTLKAISSSQPFWSERAAQVVKRTLTCCENPLASFILMPCNESLTTIIYPEILAVVENHPRFEKFSTFLNAHIALDGDEHGEIALKWLHKYIELVKPSNETILEATEAVLKIYKSPRDNQA